MSAKILHLIPMTEMPNRIRELRVAMTPKMSLEKLGGLVGVSRMTMSDLERGEIELTVSYMRKIAKALGVRPTDLMHVDDNPDALTSEERDLIHRLRAASDDERATLHRVTEAVLLSKDKQAA